jgi:hypothetical protein
MAFVADMPSAWPESLPRLRCSPSRPRHTAWVLARQIERQPPDRPRAGFLAIGFFLASGTTIIRDVGLLVGSAVSSWLIRPSSCVRYSALAVPILAALFTFVGYVNAPPSRVR